MKRVNSLTLIKMFGPYIRRVPLSFIWFVRKEFKNERLHWFNNQVRINSGIPPYPSNAFDRFFDIFINQKRIPHTVNFAITSACPYRCPHCLYGKRKKENFTTDQIIEIVNEIKDLGAAVLGISGGEPMLRSDLEEIISAASPELATIVFTTGYNLNKNRAEKLFKAGIVWMTIGIESTNEVFQDKVRGKKGSLQDGINAIKCCKEAGLYTVIGTIGTREKMNNGELNRIYDLANSLDVEEIRLIPPGATGSWDNHTDEILTPDELERHKEFQIKHNKKRTGPIVTSIAYLESEEMFGCFGGYNFLYIDSSGEVCPCDLTPLSFGNVKNKSLKEIWKDMEKYFPQPRLKCLMREISPKIISDSYPLTPNESKKIVPPYKTDSPLPMYYKKLRKGKQ